jgi:hypothetical protein
MGEALLGLALTDRGRGRAEDRRRVRLGQSSTSHPDTLDQGDTT